MQLVYYRGRVPNFGDELNTFVWPRLLPPGVLDEDESELFVGIGSIIGTQLSKTARKFVMGSGYAGYMGLPDVHDGTWDIRFVRGPQTAAALGLPAETAICDSAILLRAMDLPPPLEGVGVAFMPHYESLERGFWAKACELAGITLIDATQPVETVLRQIRGARVVITEAMHGAIVADALRVPWIAAQPLFWGHRFKWLDWSGALGLSLRMHALQPTNLLEVLRRSIGPRRAFRQVGTDQPQLARTMAQCRTDLSRREAPAKARARRTAIEPRRRHRRRNGESRCRGRGFRAQPRSGFIGLFQHRPASRPRP